MSQIGWKVKLTKAMLGNPVGAIGYVINEYPDFDIRGQVGVQVMFENGSYDGFSRREQISFLKFIRQVPVYMDYKFKSALQAYKDYRGGMWDFKDQA